MASATSGRDPLEKLAEEFAERYRRGERPALTEYTERYPELAEQIRDLFPALVEMEQLGSVEGPLTGPHMPAVPGDEPPPRQLGEYRILRQVGRGGMAVVYEAVQESLGRHVALKVLPFQALGNPTYLQRFRREAQAAARLHHTNIVPVFGVGQDHGVHYYAMQFIQGQSLDLVLQELKRLRTAKAAPGWTRPSAVPALTITVAEALLSGQFPEQQLAGAGLALGAGPPSPPVSPPGPDPATAVAKVRPSGASGSEASQSEFAHQPLAQYFRSVARVGVQAAEALEYAHRNGILHRDVKPSNLLLDTQGTVWVSDFGLAKSDDNDGLTTPGDIVGTLRFMAPERFRGQADPRSDVYSLGITLYELLTLRPAYEGTDRARLVERVTHADPPRPRKLDPHIPRDLETIVLKAIAKEPGGRYATAEALAEDLRRFLADRPIRARRSSLPERAWRWCRRNPVVALLLGLAASLLVLIAAGASVAAVWLRAEKDAAVRHKDAAEEARKNALDKLWQSYLDQARAGRWSGQPGRRFLSLDALRKAAEIRPGLELRNEAIAALALPDIRVVRSIPEGWPARTTAAAFDPAFEHYVRSDREGNLSLRRVADDQEVARLSGHGTYAYILRFSPDGRFLAAAYDLDGILKVWDLARKKETVVLPYAGMDFSPDGRLLAIHGQGSIDLYDLESGKRAKRLRQKAYARDGQLAFHPAGRQVAFVAKPQGVVAVYDLDAEKVVRTLPCPGGAHFLSWHPEGRLLAGARAGSGITIWDAAAGRQQAVCVEPAADFRATAFNRAGDLLASTGWDETLRLWDPWTGKLLLGGPNTGAGILPQFSRDGRQLAATKGGSALEVWEVSRGLESRSWHGAGDAAFGPGGRLLALAGGAGVVLWDLRADKGVGFVPQPGVRGALFQPGGESLLVYGAAGLHRWPVVSSGDGRLRLGPPERLDAPDNLIGAALRPDGRALVAVRDKSNEAVLLDLAGKDKNIVLRGQNWFARAALSPDGRRVATCGRHLRRPDVRVWDAGTGKVLFRLPCEGNASTAFTPDGRWLVTGNGEEYRFWNAETGEPGLTIPRDHGGTLAGPQAFSPGGKVLAVAHSTRQVRLLDVGTGAELATLTAPDPRGIEHLRFNPDGSRLAAVCNNRTVRVWDLRRIRGRLAEMGLDWDGPPSPPADGGPAGPLRVEVLPGAPPPLLRQPRKDARPDLERANEAVAKSPEDADAYYRRGLVHMRLRNFAGARDDFGRAIAFRPEHTEAHHQRGHAHERLGQLARAVEDFTAALAEQPENAHFYEARGRNYFALKEHAKALEDLRRALAIRPNAPAACNFLAWAYVMGPPGLRAPDKALPLAEKATQLAPGASQNWQTLGTVHHRLGQAREALAALQRGVGLKQGGATAYDLFVMAMCHQRLGDNARAKGCYEKALRWQEENKRKLSPSQAETLGTLRAEAKAALSNPPKP